MINNTSIKQFEISLGTNPAVYFPGQAVNGKVILDLERQINIASIQAQCLGFSSWNVHRRTSTRHHHYDINSRKETFIDDSETLWENVEGNLQEMPVGQYEFNFNFPLPIDKKLPSSAELMWYDSRIRYCIIATLNDKKKKLYRTVKVFTFLEIIDVNRPEFKAPPPLIEVENTSCCLCYQSLPTLLTISTDRSAYCPGESIKFEVVCDNMTSSRIKYIAAKLARTTDLHVGERTFPHVRHYYSEVRSTEEISGGQSFTWHEASMKIPSLPPSIKSNFITVSYELLIIAKFVHSPNQLASAPITIGSIPLNLQPDPSPPASDVNRLQFANVVFEGCVDDCGRNINSKNKFKPFYPVARI